MKKLLNAAMVVCISFVLIYGCDSINNPVSQNESDSNMGVLGSVSEDPVLINNYNVKFTGSEFKNGTTTFSYSVSFVRNPASNNFYLQIPECAVDAFRPDLLGMSPNGPIQYPYNDPHSKTTGVYWKSSLSRGTSEFSITFDGEIPTGMISATVESGNRNGTEKVAGPCEGYVEEVKKVDITGVVFVDVDGDKVKNDDYETGLYNVVVELVDSDDNSSTTTTDLEGKFIFEQVPAGEYTVRIPELIGQVEFNKNFFDTYDFAGFPHPIEGTKPERTVEAQDDVSDIDFAFSANIQALVSRFTNQTILTNTQTVEFWRKNVRAASNNSQGNFEVRRQDIYNYLNKIQDNDFFTKFTVKLPDDPFQFGTGNNRQRAEVAYDIMFNPSPVRPELELFLEQLLVAQFNIVSGIYGVGGFVISSANECSTAPISQNGTMYCSDNIEEFHLALLAYGEGVAAEYIQNEMNSAALKTSVSTVSNLSLQEATDVFSTFNRTGGGGLGF